MWGWPDPNIWAELSLEKDGPIPAQKWLGRDRPNVIFLFLGRVRPSHLGWAITGPTQTIG